MKKRVKNTLIYEEVKDMTIENLFALIFLSFAVFGRIICEMIDRGAFDIIAVRLTNYIVSRIERNEGKDI